MRALKLFSGITGTIAVLVAIPLLIAGIALFALGAGDGTADLPTLHVHSSGRALTADDIDVRHDGDWWLDIGDVHIRAADEDDLFIGVGPADEVRRFLRTGERPGTQSFWVRDDTGQAVEIDWTLENGDWSVVVMNADGTAGVDARIDVELPAWPIRLGATLVTGLGVIMAAAGAGLMWLGWRRSTAPRTPPTPPAPQPEFDPIDA